MVGLVSQGKRREKQEKMGKQPEKLAGRFNVISAEQKGKSRRAHNDMGSCARKSARMSIF
jgi:hypothetical protein